MSDAPFRKLLVANRGEIALRVGRACEELGLPWVVVHSSRDRASAAVRAAPESVQIGPAPPGRSYLNAAAVLQAARQTGADAIHPGYGFLSESADFAEACEQAGITLVGPPADVMAQLGNKGSARRLMAAAGLPLLPGSFDTPDPSAAFEVADEVGFPLIIKAVAGGGGRGMVVVRQRDELAPSLRQARATAQKLFGDGRVYVERFLAPARHVEVQVLADRHGHVLHLGERDCTVQRRHQKVVEEAPAPRLPDGLAERMAEAAVVGAQTAGYVGAGTFEFLVGPDGDFHFMEVNCRIQVEHPLTEMVTGIDLVRAQIEVAAGEPLALAQGDVAVRGAAVECRINAEDPARGWLPTPGVVDELVWPAGPFVRVDSGLQAGDAVPPEYDSLLAKLVVWAPDRAQALARMRRALGELHVAGDGLCTTREFLTEVLDDPRFVAAEHSTAVVDQLLAERSHGAEAAA